jgi:hypothetical protein
MTTIISAAEKIRRGTECSYRSSTAFNGSRIRGRPQLADMNRFLMKSVQFANDERAGWLLRRAARASARMVQGKAGLRTAKRASMEQKRAAARLRVLKAGSIEFGGGAIDCTVRNISESGAALEVVTPLFIPDRFTLVVQTAQLKRPCHIIWRRERRIGVAFD